MNAIFKWAALAAVTSLGSTLPAYAKAGDKAWAQCVWSQAPNTANLWLSSPVPTWQTKYDDLSVRLGHRLIALCDGSIPDPLRPNRIPSWKAFASVLKGNKPKTPAPDNATNKAQVFLCRSSIVNAGNAVTFLYEFVRRADGKDTISFQQYYTHDQGMALKLPQDLRIVPKTTETVSRKCQSIGENGELTDA